MIIPSLIIYLIYILYIIFSLFMFLTYHPVIHGPRLTYYFTTFFTQLLSVWFASRFASSQRYSISFTAVLILFLIQIWKLSHPILTENHSSLITSFDAGSNWTQHWTPVTQGLGGVTQEASTVNLIQTNNLAQSLHVNNLPILPTEVFWSSFMRPILEPQRIHEKRSITIECSLKRVLPYLKFLSSNRFTIQLVSNGILITSPLLSKDVSADFIPFAPDTLEQFRTWRVIADGGMMYIFLDDTPIWTHIQIDTFDNYIIGEQSLDSEHGGSIHVKEIRITRETFLH